jgi:hypothetical protein
MPKENHVTKIECSSFTDKIGVENQSPSKLVSSGVKIILVPGLANSGIPAPKILKRLTPVISAAKDLTKNSVSYKYI